MIVNKSFIRIIFDIVNLFKTDMMVLDSLISLSFSSDELNAVDEAIKPMQAMLSRNMINLIAI